MLALSGLAFIATLLSTPAAHASHWDVTLTDKGGSQSSYLLTGLVTDGHVTAWTPPAVGNNSTSFTFNDGTDGYAGSSESSMAQVNMTLTLTWVADPAGDPAPTQVWIVENASAGAYASGADASASGSDGLQGDVYFSDYYNQSSDVSSGSMTTPSELPGGGRLTKLMVSGTSVSFDRALTASSSSSYSESDFRDAAATISLSYSLTIHPQPYNMRLSPNPDGSPAVYVDNVDGRLLFHYSISSTDGNTHDLTSITAYETLDWSGNPAPPGAYVNGFYFPPSPPVAPYSDTGQPYAYKTTDKAVSPTLLQGYFLDGFSPPNTGFVAPYPAPSTTWSATQNYLFDDSATGEIGIKIPGPDNNSPFTITRSVTPTNAAGTTGLYSINTHGSAALKSLP